MFVILASWPAGVLTLSHFSVLATLIISRFDKPSSGPPDRDTAASTVVVAAR